jgi:hypothetical protein
MGQCIFCGAVGKLTKEHVWADWLKEFIPKDALSHTAHRHILQKDGTKANPQLRVVGGDVKSKRVKCVCASLTHQKTTKQEGCNDGWMGRLQEAAKPIVIPLVKGRSTSLTPRQQGTFAAWVAMSVMCGEYHRDETVTIPQSHRTRLYKTHRPPKKHWKIWIGDYERKLWVPERARFVLSITGEETTESRYLVPPPANTQTTAFTVGRLYVLCISSIWKEPVDGFVFSASDLKLLRQVWPVCTAVVTWPPSRHLSDADADRFASEFRRRVTGF